MGRRHGEAGRGIAAAGMLAALLAACGTAAAQEGHPLPPATYGTGLNQLSLEPAPAASKPKIDEQAARKAIEHPPLQPAGEQTFKGLGLFSVSSAMLMGQGTIPSGGLKHHLAWVGLYEITNIGLVSCGNSSPKPASGALHPRPHYAVIVDAQTGTTYEWTEDQHLGCGR